MNTNTILVRRKLGYRSTFAFFYAEEIRAMAHMTLTQRLDSARSQLRDLRELVTQKLLKEEGRFGTPPSQRSYNTGRIAWPR